MILKLILLFYVLFLSRLYLPVKLVFSLILLYILQDLENRSDLQRSKSLPATLPPGTVISYSYRNLLDTSLNPLLPYRLMFSRYPHKALVVTHEEKPHVLEWRYYPLKELEQYTVKTLRFGYISLIPLDSYLEIVSRHNVIFSVYHPPKTIQLEYDKERVDEIVKGKTYLTCTYFASSYLKNYLEMSDDHYPILFTPERCQSILRKNRWKQEYYIYNK